jgi:hypothetical protein
MEQQQQELVSLFDYLGYAAGPTLGQQVADTASKLKERIGARHVSTRTYKGLVHLYRPQFLKEFFEAKKLGLDPTTAMQYLNSLK